MSALTWPQVLAWRLRRQHLDPVDGPDAVSVTRRLVGVQAQVPSAAALALAVRRRDAEPDDLQPALASGALLRTWAMRGTLHLLPPDLAASLLALVAAARTWEKPSWQRAFLPAPSMQRLTEAVLDVLGAEPMSRAELTSAVLARTDDADLVEHLGSGWSTVLKPLAWQGLLCQGPSTSGRISFVAPRAAVPRWPGLPTVDEAAAVAVPAYLGAYGPATPEAFDAWLLRGASPKRAVRGWFAAAHLVEVDVEGTRLFARAEDVDGLGATEPSTVVRLLPAFDQYVLGPGTSDPVVVPAAHRADVSRAAGRIAPVVVAGGRVVGTWDDRGDGPDVALWPDADVPVDPAALEAEVARVAGLAPG